MTLLPLQLYWYSLENSFQHLNNPSTRWIVRRSDAFKATSSKLKRASNIHVYRHNSTHNSRGIQWNQCYQVSEEISRLFDLDLDLISTLASDDAGLRGSWTRLSTPKVHSDVTPAVRPFSIASLATALYAHRVSTRGIFVPWWFYRQGNTVPAIELKVDPRRFILRGF